MEEYAIVRSQKKLRSYQKNVVRFMKQHNRLFVFHKMGTGKTLTAVTVSQSYLDQYPHHKVIVISPTTQRFLTSNRKDTLLQKIKNHQRSSSSSSTRRSKEKKEYENRCGIRITKKPSDHDFLDRIFGITRK